MWFEAMRQAGKWALIAALGLVPAGADAAVYDFDFSTTDSLFTATGSITTANTPDAVGGYDILSISGTLSGPSGGTIALVPNPAQPSPTYTANFGYDNVYYPGAVDLVDLTGVLFTAGVYDYNVFAYGGTYYLSTDNPAGVYNPGEPITFSDPIQSATAAPEPSTWAMMLIGLAGLGLAARRQARARKIALGAQSIGAAEQA
jgi:PEP-CTERM motif